MLLGHQNGKLPQDFHTQTLRPCEMRSGSSWSCVAEVSVPELLTESHWNVPEKKRKKLLLYFCLNGCVNTCICSWCVIMLQCKIQSDFMGNDRQIAWVIKMQMLSFSSSSSFASIHCLLILCRQQQKWELRRISSQMPRLYSRARSWHASSRSYNQIWPQMSSVSWGNPTKWSAERRFRRWCIL